MPNVWFTSDTHFSHQNIIKYCNRPFTSVEEMDEAIIQNWNEKVKAGDRIYHIGDFSFATPSKYLKRLTGQKYFIHGNHDYIKDHELIGWVWIKNYHELKIGNQTIILNHYAQRVWNKMHRGAWHLFGHSHGNLPPYGKSFDVGVDCFNYSPISFEEVQAKMDELPPITGIGKDY